MLLISLFPNIFSQYQHSNEELIVILLHPFFNRLFPTVLVCIFSEGEVFITLWSCKKRQMFLVTVREIWSLSSFCPPSSPISFLTVQSLLAVSILATCQTALHSWYLWLCGDNLVWFFKKVSHRYIYFSVSKPFKLLQFLITWAKFCHMTQRTSVLNSLGNRQQERGFTPT